jgi:hypothetical protein
MVDPNLSPDAPPQQSDETVREKAALRNAAPEQHAPAAPRKAGRPTYKEPANFDAALMQLSPAEAAFVRARLSGLSIEDSYKSGHPTANPGTARRNGSRLAHRLPVQSALKHGHAELAAETRIACRFDLENAHRQLQEHVAGAIAAKQWNAVASIDRELLKMHKLTDAKENVAVSGFSIVIHQADGTVKSVGADEAPKVIPDGQQ